MSAKAPHVRTGKLLVLAGGLLGAAGIGSLVARMSAPAILLPVALAGLIGLWRFSELAILLLQDYLGLITTPLSWVVTLPALPLSLPFVAIWAAATGWRHVFGGQKLIIGWGMVLHMLLAALIVMNFVAFAEHTPYASSKFFLFMTLNLTSFLGGATLSRDQLSRVFFWMMGLGGIVALLTYQAFVAGTPIMPGRYTALELNPIWACRLALLGALTTLVILPDKRWGLGYLAAALPAAFLTGSRGPMLAALMACSGLAALWWLAPRKHRDLPGKPTLIGLSLGIGLLHTLLSLAPAFAQETRPFIDGETANSRLTLYAKALQGFSDHVLFGMGIGGFESLVSFTETGEEIRFPHNIFLEFAVEFGVFGVALFTALLIHYLWLALEHVRHVRRHPADPSSGWGIAATLGFLNLIIAAQFSGDLVTNHALWFFMGLMTRVDTLRRFSEDAIFPDPEASKLV